MKEIRIQEKRTKTVAFLTLGCKVNSYETDGMKRLFSEAGYEIKEFEEQADVYIINTCTVTNIADRKSRQMLHRAKKKNPDSIVVAVGCYVQAAAETLEEDDAIDLVIGNNKKNEIVAILEEYFGNTELREALVDIGQEREFEELSFGAGGEKTRAYIKVQDGCNQFCSYCIIPYARGRVRSRKLEEVVNEVKRLVKEGYQEVVLTGIHLSSYGIDFDEDITLLTLIQTISTVDGLKRIRLGSLEPRIITEEFVDTLKQNPLVCPHFHLSMQSGCTETLKRMNRRYTADEFYEKCQLLRSGFDEPAITTDVIVGFPGETDEEFEETKAFVQKVAFAQIHVFKYSKRKGTKAAVMENQIPEDIKHHRSIELMAIEQQMRKFYQQQFIGQEQKVLVEESILLDGITYQIGHNERYQKLAIQTEKDLSNQMIEVKVLRSLTEELLLCEIFN